MIEISGLKVRQENFVRDDGEAQSLSTAKLTEYVEQWIKQGESLDQEQEAKHVAQVDDCLREASKYIRNLAWDGEWSMGFLVQETAVAVLGLFGTLINARDRRASRLPGGLKQNPLLGARNVGISAITHRRLSESCWCPSQVEKLLASIPFENVLFYLGEMKRPDTGDHIDHSKCSSAQCLANQVVEGAYRTRHATDDCDCKSVQVDSNKITRILLSGDYPLVKILRDPDGTVQLQVVPRQTCLEYVAISHIWGHGLGRVGENAQPTCQLLRLKRFLEDLWDFHWRGNSHGALSDLKKQPVAMWIDTLCVPVDPQLKKAAIKQMREVYHRARDVLVLDREVSQSHYGDFIEANFRICCSDWSRRLWTYQESALSQNLIFQFANEQVHYTRDYVLQIGGYFDMFLMLGSPLFPGDLQNHYDRHNYAAATLRSETMGPYDLESKD